MDQKKEEFVRSSLEAFIRIGLVFLTVYWCFLIFKPFLLPFVWAIIIAVATTPIFKKILKLCRGRKNLAATVYVIAFLSILLVPTIYLSDSMVKMGKSLSVEFAKGEIQIPDPPENANDIPIIGDQLTSNWELAQTNLTEVVKKFGPQIKKLGRWLVGFVADLGLMILIFVFSIIIAGVFLANAEGGYKTAKSISEKLIGERGGEFVEVSKETIGNVAISVLGVSFIQTLFASLGFVIADIPGAGFWALAFLILAIIQLPPVIILIPLIVYVFSVSSTGMAVFFMIWSILVTLSDNFLKAWMMGGSKKTPALVVLIGSVGGMVLSGIIGLFIGAVVLVLGYELFGMWIKQGGNEDQKITLEKK